MDSICSLIDKYVKLSETKNELENSSIVSNDLKKIRRNELMEINKLLDLIVETFLERLDSMNEIQLNKEYSLLNSNYNRINKDIDNIKISINSLIRVRSSKTEESIKGKIRYAEMISEKYLMLNDLNIKRKSYESFLGLVSNKINQKVYHKAVV